MKKNVGGLDRGIRFAVGISGLAIALFGRVGIYGRLKALLFGFTGFYTAATEYCPLSEYLGVNTRVVEKTRKREIVQDAMNSEAEKVTPVI
ncbi:MAG TPA: DUF2892 domain-containing protein [Verrucomicrobiae bacterium]